MLTPTRRDPTRRPNSKRLYGGLLVIILGAITLVLSSIANGPDRDLHFTRDVHSKAMTSFLSGALLDTSLWPNWFFSLVEVKRAGASTSRPDSPPALAPGMVLNLLFNNRKSPWSSTEITVKVLSASPTRLALEILEDSKGKLTRLFDHLQWEIELIPENRSGSEAGSGAQGTLIRGKATARTAHWRSRLTGTLTEKILMNQVYYLDLIRLAELKSLTPGSGKPATGLSASDSLLSLPAGLDSPADDSGKN